MQLSKTTRCLISTGSLPANGASFQVFIEDNAHAAMPLLLMLSVKRAESTSPVGDTINDTKWMPSMVA